MFRIVSSRNKICNIFKFNHNNVFMESNAQNNWPNLTYEHIIEALCIGHEIRMIDGPIMYHHIVTVSLSLITIC